MFSKSTCAQCEQLRLVIIITSISC